MKIEFTTAAFERSRGRRPQGYGCWAFQKASALTAFEHEREGEVYFFTGTLTDATHQIRTRTELAGLVAVLP